MNGISIILGRKADKEQQCLNFFGFGAIKENLKSMVSLQKTAHSCKTLRRILGDLSDVSQSIVHKPSASNFLFFLIN